MAQVIEDKKVLILDAARRLLIGRGFQDLALDDIAREAGVAKGRCSSITRARTSSSPPSTPTWSTGWAGPSTR